ncbi:MAG: site-2 protease family protein [Eubacteriales bacterium]
MSYIVVCLIIGLILLIHETGHFIVARAAKIPVERFSIGMGPRLWGFQKGGTDFCISLIPFGGYVLPQVEAEDDFFKISPLRRICFSLGGPLANLLSVIPMLAVFNIITKGPSFSGIFLHPWMQAGIYMERIVTAIPLVFSHPQQLSGIVGIVSQGSQVVNSGMAGLLALTAFLSINLAILNLLPIPALDGGQILMTLLEKVWPKSVKIRIPIAILGWLFLICLMVYMTSKDISRLLG